MNVDLLRRAKREWSQNGATKLTKKSIRYAYRRSPLAETTSVYQEKRQQGNRSRWQLIEPELSDHDAFMLDVGCNAGFFCERATEAGLTSLGVDLFANQGTLRAALETLQSNDGVGILRRTLTPANVDDLPTADVTLLLSIYHHWYSEFGEEAAREMLRSFADTDKIFFEPPSESHRYVETGGPTVGTNGREVPEPNFDDNDRESVVSYHTDLLTSVFGETHDVSVLGSSDRMGTRRYLFFVENR